MFGGNRLDIVWLLVRRASPRYAADLPPGSKELASRCRTAIRESASCCGPILLSGRRNDDEDEESFRFQRQRQKRGEGRLSPRSGDR